MFASMRRICPLLGLMAVPGLAATSQALAQSTPSTQPADTSTKLEEVVVTARKRDESYQNVPISVTPSRRSRFTPRASRIRATSSPWCRT